MSNPLFDVASAPEVASAPPEGVPIPNAAAGGPPPPVNGAVGVISAPQTAITFAGAPAAATLVWKVLGVLIPTWANSRALAIGISIVIGMLIYWASAPVVGVMRVKVIGFVFALINSFAIAAATLGIDSTAGTAGPKT